MSNTISFHTDVNKASTLYTLDWIFKVLGIRALKIDDSRTEKIDFYYGNNESIRNRIRIPYNPEHVLRIIEPNTTPISFDLINAIQSLLTDSVNRPLSRDKLDGLFRLPSTNSFQYANGIITKPVVNQYLLQIRNLIEDKLGVITRPFWPDGKKLVILLTHDVDNPLGRKVIQKLPEMIANTKSPAFYLYTFLRIINNIIDTDYWHFDEIMEMENQFGVKSSFFFSIIPSWLSGNWRDVLYSIQDMKFQEILKALTQGGWEVGLHASLNAHKSKEDFLQEKKTLEKLTGVHVVGLRHHYWFLGPEAERTMEMHSDLGFLYDLSIGFDDVMGFRRSVAFPYFPWSESHSSATRTLQIPNFCMDGHLFYKKGSTYSKMRKFWTAFRNLRSSEGVGVLNWHARASSPNGIKLREWGRAYESILHQITKDQSIWIPTPLEFTNYILKSWKGYGLVSS